MIGRKLLDINEEIKKHFRNLHGNVLPKPNPDNLSFRDDFKVEEVELTQYGGFLMDHLTFTYTTRQFSSDDYMVSVITFHHYDECIKRIENDGRIDLELYEYF